MTQREEILLKMATDLGRMHAFAESDFSKSANILERLVLKAAPYWVPASMGYILGGPEHREEGALAGLGLGLVGGGLGRALGVRKLRDVIRKTPAFKKYRHLDDLALLSEMKHATPGSQLHALREDVLPLINQYQWGGRLAGGPLGGLLMGKALGAQGEPDLPQMNF